MYAAVHGRICGEERGESARTRGFERGVSRCDIRFENGALLRAHAARDFREIRLCRVETSFRLKYCGALGSISISAATVPAEMRARAKYSREPPGPIFPRVPSLGLRGNGTYERKRRRCGGEFGNALNFNAVYLNFRGNLGIRAGGDIRDAADYQYERGGAYAASPSYSGDPMNDARPRAVSAKQP